MNLVEVPGSEFTLKADLVLLAMGFVGPRKPGLVEQAGVELDPRGNVKAAATNYKTSAAKIFSCGDMRRGQSLVVWAIREGRQCARGVDEFLMGVRATAALVRQLRGYDNRHRRGVGCAEPASPPISHRRAYCLFGGHPLRAPPARWHRQRAAFRLRRRRASNPAPPDRAFPQYPISLAIAAD